MRKSLRLAFVVAVVAALAACSQVAPQGPGLQPASAGTQGAVRTLSYLGSASFTVTPQAAQYGLQNPEFPSLAFEHDVGTAGTQSASGTPAGRSGRVVNRIPQKKQTPVTPPRGGNVAPQGQGGTHGPGAAGSAVGASFQGLNHFDERYADGGNQFSLEPPDQGLCAGNGFVMEAVNDVLQVYDQSGNAGHGVVSLNQFFYGEHAIDRTNGVYGHFITDPSCLYDSSDGGHWYLVVLTLDVDPATGAFLGTNHLDIATSATNDPLGAWNRYSLDVSHDGSPDCAPGTGPSGYCLGDYPHFAVNADGLFITTDSFPFFTSGYNGAWLYGVQKSALESGGDAAVVAQALPDTAGSSYSVAPALNVGSLPSGVEYMVSATTANTSSSSTIAVWAVSNTASLDHGNPSLTVTSELVGVGGPNGLSSNSYGDAPYYIPQKAGSVPLAQALTGNRFGFGAAPGKQTEGLIATNDSGMKQAVFVGGKLYSALTTIADNGAGPNGGPGAGAAWFEVTPDLAHNGSFSASLDRAGVVAPQGQNVIFPAITVTPSGSGAITATLVGPNDYPSAAVIPFGSAGAGAPSVVMQGVGPQDGFTEYWLGGDSPRWGDYGAAVVDPATGNLWLASEAIHQTCSYTTFIKDPTCGQTRSALANWSTQITEITP